MYEPLEAPLLGRAHLAKSLELDWVNQRLHSVDLSILQPLWFALVHRPIKWAFASVTSADSAP